jgi:phosphoglycerol transferase MdoB-like AlkP superfamily enzyme
VFRFAVLRLWLGWGLVTFTATRLLLVALTWRDADLGPLALMLTLGRGAVYDLAFLAYALILPAQWVCLATDRFWRSRLNAVLMHGALLAWLFALNFIAIAEYLFWDEFSTRFNFIAADYLLNAQEVVANIRQSYPVGPLLTGALLLAVVYHLVGHRQLRASLRRSEPARRRLLAGFSLLLLPAAGFLGLGQDLQGAEMNTYRTELGRNGPYQFVAAFLNNHLDYGSFYPQLPMSQAWSVIRGELAASDSHFVADDPLPIQHEVVPAGAERRLNVVLVMVESLSAGFLTEFGSTQALTPNLDRLSEESLFFTRLYATGTRTVRGLEAVTLSIPPTPGHAVVKRIGHERDMYSLGRVFGMRGYDVRFIYGGRGFFDNMTSFFSGNGYAVTDQASIPEEDVSFANAWGMADEDLFRVALREADADHAAGRPFFLHLMTTSNHRPYTYPAGRVPIPSGSGRDGAVQYTDYAIGKLLEQARQRPWFDDTVFVVVADHCARAYGKDELPIDGYHIPMWIHAPSRIQARRVDTLASLIDVGPTILGLLRFSYTAPFFGRDILTTPPAEGRALLATHQALGLYRDDTLTILSPVRQIVQRVYTAGAAAPEIRRPGLDDPDVLATVAYYQSASYMLDHRLNAWSEPQAPALLADSVAAR